MSLYGYLFRLQLNRQKNSVNSMDHSIIRHHVTADNLRSVSIQISSIGTPHRDDVTSNGPLIGSVEEQDALGDARAAEVTLQNVVIDNFLGQGLVLEDLFQNSLTHAVKSSIGGSKEGEWAIGIQFILKFGKGDQFYKLLVFAIVFQHLDTLSTCIRKKYF